MSLVAWRKGVYVKFFLNMMIVIKVVNEKRGEFSL